MSRKNIDSPKNNKSSSTNKSNNMPIIVAIIGLTGTLITAYFGFRASSRPIETIINATQTVEAMKTIVVTPTAKELELPIQENPDPNPELVTFPSISIVEHEDEICQWVESPLGSLSTGDTEYGIGIVEVFRNFCGEGYEPTFDIVIMSMTERPIVITGLGIEIIGVFSSPGAGGGGVGPPTSLKIEVQGAYELDMPDIFSEFVHLTDDYGRYDLQRLNRVVSTRLIDPIYMQPQSVFRYKLMLKNFSASMPINNLIRLWVKTNDGDVRSRIIYMVNARYPYPYP
jgi:hypothetical protein